MADASGETVTMATANEDDERTMELSALQAIFPELVIDEKQQFTATLELPIAPSESVPIVFKDVSDDSPIEADRQLQIHRLSYLPNIHIGITLPEGYPAEKPPVLELSATPNWLPRRKIHELLGQCKEFWEDIGHDQVLYMFIDHIQDSALGAFGLLDREEHLQLSPDLEIELLDHDKSAKQAEFDRQSYDCGVCLEPKRGATCHKLNDCGHVFCRQCLQDFYNNAITEGDLDSVKCLDPGCAKKREEEFAISDRKRKPKVTLLPSELLLIPLEHEMVKRYVTMRHKIELENDKSTVYCPRSFCQGAARSKKHTKPIITPTFATATADEEADEESDDELASIDPTKPPNRSSLLRVCEDCLFAFCSRCLQTWHGEYVLCGPPRNTSELSAEDKASLEYIKFHTTPCPTCAVPAQKTHGCNHMICQRCGTHFCYLCSSWLDVGNPYQHYNTETTGCYQRLWELEGGDGNDVGYNYAGGDHPPDEGDFSDDGSDDEGPADMDGQLPMIEDMRLEPQPFIAEPGQDPIVDGEHEGDPGDQPQAQNDGPLVLRLGPVPPRPAPAPAPRARRGQPNPQAAPGRLGGRFARAAARRAAAEVEEAERRLNARNAAWNRRMGRDARPEHGGPDM
ncbi:translation termination inhibitor protein itt1 [Pseudogymnoascus verrucosus]|uniref:RBR-type E3 ubiquitin transferase n=1 Tax=Pseudogymnoascus verrucosus TaxID=342668 RepID=A0A1B8GA56_9PEZI|nr:translation termination inhibitor protein itt1 [Pseudogymnoascus verrucosus]OBT92708.1 translation termination inhibitor protein itt1 [Pseudogymnoascus verrucosus]